MSDQEEPISLTEMADDISSIQAIKDDEGVFAEDEDVLVNDELIDDPKSNEPSFAEEHSVLDQYLVACQGGNLLVIKDFIENGLVEINDTKDDKITGLHWAAINNRLSIVKYLVDQGAIVDVKGGDLDATPLHWACRYGLVYVVDYLLKKGANPNITDNQGFNGLHLAVHSSNIMLVVYIIVNTKIYIDEPDPSNRTALHWAAYQGDSLSVHTLLRFGADISKKDNEGFLPLHWSLIRGTKSIIKELLEHGSSVFEKNNSDKDSFQVSIDMSCNDTLLQCLKEIGKSSDGFTIPRKISDFHAKLMTFFLPYIALPLILASFTLKLGNPLFNAVLAVVIFYVQYVFLSKVLLPIYVLEQTSSPMIKSPYYAGIFSATTFWVVLVWLFRIFPSLLFHNPIPNFLFFVCAFIVVSTFFKALIINPGYVPLPVENSSIAKQIDDLMTIGKYDANHFDINTFVRKPLRSRYSNASKRLVARFDHYCPWVYNEIGVRNHKLFLTFVYALELAIIAFIYLSVEYFDYVEDSSDDLTCSLLNEELCAGYTYERFHFGLLCWSTFQLVWVTSLIFVQTFQILKGVTTWEFSTRKNNHKHSGGQSFSSVPSDLLADDSDSTSNGPGSSGDHAGHGHSHGRKKNMFGSLSALLGFDQFASIARSTMSRKRERNPTDFGIRQNWLDFWFLGDLKFRNLFFLPIEGENNLNGNVVDYYKLFEYPKQSAEMVV